MEFASCAVCGRTILRGERSFAYLDADGAEAGVCPLCKATAEANGWVPAAFATVAPPPQPRRRRGAAALRERFARPRGAPVAEPDEPPEPPSPLEVFNASPEARKVAGLRRSLGEPRACVRPQEEGEGQVVTVAWDLSWYRWSVRGATVKQVGSGNEISELPLEDRDWNATVAEDGSLARA